MCPEELHPSRALGVLGMPGFTAYMGLLDIRQPVSGGTVFIAASSGPVGSVVGQIARVKGCTVVGIAGGEGKCRYVIDELGFDFCVDHHGAGLPGRLAAACPKGIDVYFENVGGAVFDDYGQRWSEFAGAMVEWVQQEKVKVREGIVFGLENAPEAFVGLLEGKNFGKLVIQLAQE